MFGIRKRSLEMAQAMPTERPSTSGGTLPTPFGCDALAQGKNVCMTCRTRLRPLQIPWVQHEVGCPVRAALARGVELEQPASTARPPDGDPLAALAA
jgi:hypothetical protein